MQSFIIGFFLDCWTCEFCSYKFQKLLFVLFFQTQPTKVKPYSQTRNSDGTHNTMENGGELVPRTFSDDGIAHRAPSVFEILNGRHKAQQK